MGNQQAKPAEPSTSAARAMKDSFRKHGIYAGVEVFTFLCATGFGFDEAMTDETEACRYWMGKDGIFITHIKCQINGKAYELSRMDVIDLWITAVTMEKRTSNVRWRLSEYYGSMPGCLPLDASERQQCIDLVKFHKKVSTMTYHATFLLTKLAADEAIGQPRAQWTEWDTPGFEVDDALGWLDPSLPLSVYLFNNLLLLRKTMTEENIALVAAFEGRMGVVLSASLTPPQGIWRKRIMAMSDVKNQKDTTSICNVKGCHLHEKHDQLVIVDDVSTICAVGNKEDEGWEIS